MLQLKRYKVPAYFVGVGTMIVIVWFNIEGSVRYRRSLAVVDDERAAHGRHVHPWVIIASSVITIILLVLVSLLCVGGDKKAAKSSSSKSVIILLLHYLFFKSYRAPVNATQEASGKSCVIFNKNSFLFVGFYSKCYRC